MDHHRGRLGDPARRGAGRPVLLFALLYLSEGAPIGFIWWALPTLLRSSGVEIGTITSLTAALVLPWTLKFLWAPVVDALRGPRWDRRHWITLAQIGMGVCLLPLVVIEPTGHTGAWVGLLLAHAVLAATQDVAIDGLVIQSVPPDRRGSVNGAMQAGMLVGRSLFGGVSIVVANRLGLGFVLASLVVVIWATLVMLWWWGPVEEGLLGVGVREETARVFRSLRGMLTRPATWFAAGFAVLGGAAFEAAGALRGPYLFDHGASEGAIGWFFALPSTFAMLVGGLIGGWFSDRVGRLRAVAGFLVLIVAVVIGLALLPGSAPASARFTLFAVLYLGIGLFTASSYALFMDLSDPTAGATQFSAFMAATNACEAGAAWGGGRLVESAGYGAAFLVMAGVSLASLALLPGLRRRD